MERCLLYLQLNFHLGITAGKMRKEKKKENILMKKRKKKWTEMDLRQENRGALSFLVFLLSCWVVRKCKR